MSHVAKLASMRVSRAKDNSKITAIDLLHSMIHDIESGELKVDGLLLLHIKRDERWDYGSYRYNMTRDQELVLLELEKDRLMKRWTGG